MMKSKTPLMRYLDEQQVNYTVLPHQRPATSIEDAALQRGIHPCCMVKCIALRDMGHVYALACVPGDCAVDPKKVRQLLQCRRMTCVSAEHIEPLTGYPLGGVTPLLLKTPMLIVFDRQIFMHSVVTISRGDNLGGLALSIDTLVNLCHPTIAAICRE